MDYYQNSKHMHSTLINYGETPWKVESDRDAFSVFEYIANLFHKHSRLLVIRLDLHFEEWHRGKFDAEASRQCLQRLLNNSRCNRIFANMVGYIWSLEFGAERGFHYHCIFFFDGSKSQQDITIGHAIGQYWRENITNGGGTYYCSNIDKLKFDNIEKLGIGMIHRDNDMARRYNLLYVASYLLKVDDSMRLVLPETTRRFRTFGRGEI